MAVFVKILLKLMLSVAFQATHSIAIMRRVVIVLLINVGGKINGGRFSVTLNTRSVLRSLHRLRVVVTLSALNISVETSH